MYCFMPVAEKQTIPTINILSATIIENEEDIHKLKQSNVVGPQFNQSESCHQSNANHESSQSFDSNKSIQSASFQSESSAEVSLLVKEEEKELLNKSVCEVTRQNLPPAEILDPDTLGEVDIDDFVDPEAKEISRLLANASVQGDMSMDEGNAMETSVATMNGSLNHAGANGSELKGDASMNVSKSRQVGVVTSKENEETCPMETSVISESVAAVDVISSDSCVGYYETVFDGKFSFHLFTSCFCSIKHF